MNPRSRPQFGDHWEVIPWIPSLGGFKEGILWIQGYLHGFGIPGREFHGSQVWEILRREFHGSGVTSMVLGSLGENSMDLGSPLCVGDLQEGISMELKSKLHLEGHLVGIPWIQSHLHGLGITGKEFHGFKVTSMVWDSLGRNSMDPGSPPWFEDPKEGIPWIQNFHHGLGIPGREFCGFRVKTVSGRS